MLLTVALSREDEVKTKSELIGGALLLQFFLRRLGCL